MTDNNGTKTDKYADSLLLMSARQEGHMMRIGRLSPLMTLCQPVTAQPCCTTDRLANGHYR